MKRKKIVFYFIGALSLALIGLWVSQSAVVRGQSLVDYFLPSAQDTSVPMQEQPVDYSEFVLKLDEQETHSSDGGSPNQDILALVEGFNATAHEKYLQQGWLHIAQFEKAYITASESFSDGTPIPTEEWVDRWYLLAEDGEVLKSVTINDTGDPKTTQIVVYQDKFFTNLTFPNLASTEPEDSFLTNLDHGLGFRLENNPEMDVTLEQDDETGHVVIRTSTYFDGPITYESQITATGYSYVYQFDPETGIVMSFEDYYLGLDGTLVLRNRLETVIVEMAILPPDDILQYFD
jgi:hypothetical protein